jgi:hypothetical protein
MADVDDMHQGILIAFGWDQWRTNKAGIGNECTHWIYAALLEARALDFDRALHIAQTGQHYTWGRRITPDASINGDIVQFNNYRNKFTFCFRDDSGGWRWLEREYVRGPLHTAMVGIDQRATFRGQHLLLESHLHQPGVARMTIRENRVYDDNFAVALTAQEFASLRGTTTWPATVDMSDSESIARNVIWLRLRDDHPFPIRDADAAINQLMGRHMPRLGRDVAVLCRLRTSGEIRFFRPQQSPARLAMDARAFEAEKKRLIAMMIRDGRPGDGATPGHPLDEFGSDNKQVRVHDHRFDWHFSGASAH